MAEEPASPTPAPPPAPAPAPTPPPAPPPAPAPTPEPAAPEEEEVVVEDAGPLVEILSDGLSGTPGRAFMYTKGMVVPASVFPDVERLKELGAVKDYTPPEDAEPATA